MVERETISHDIDRKPQFNFAFITFTVMTTCSSMEDFPVFPDIFMITIQDPVDLRYVNRKWCAFVTAAFGRRLQAFLMGLYQLQ